MSMNVLDKIEAARKTGALNLDLSKMNIKCIPAEIGELTDLICLNISGNSLEELPEEIGLLLNLRGLDASRNRIRLLPGTIRRLLSLSDLDLSFNQLRIIPQSICMLNNLEHLNLYGNLIAHIDPDLGLLSELASLNLSFNRLEDLPGSIGDLRTLSELSLDHNRLRSLPVEISYLTSLRWIRLESNGLPGAYLAAAETDMSSFRAFIASVYEKTVPLFEAKLLITGEGKVGKTMAAAALRGDDISSLVFEGNTTWGVDRGELRLAHPQQMTYIAFNTWDFGGQAIYRVTHQFFFSPQAIYLLLWNPRAGAEQCRVREWLRTIALRTGTKDRAIGVDHNPLAKVIMVASHANDLGGGYNPDFGEDSLDDDLRALIVDRISIDSLTGYNVEELRLMIAKHAAELPDMGQPVNTRWAAARDEVLKLRQQKPWIDFSEFSTICNRHNVRADDEQRALAWAYLHRLGRALWYGAGSRESGTTNDAVLDDTIVLDAEWLSRAFVQILEDEETRATRGMLDHARLRSIWTDHGRAEWHRYQVREYGILQQVMRLFDVALPTRESHGRCSLVPQLVPFLEPSLPWTSAEAAAGARTLRMYCHLDYEAVGLAPRLIAATEPWHCYVEGKGLFWGEGVFLKDEASFSNQALIRIQGSERPRIEVVVSGVMPEFMLNQIGRASCRERV